MTDRPLSNQCPYCSSPMIVGRMLCSQCTVSVDGTFAMTRLGNLPIEHQRFIEMFVLAGGSLKELSDQTGVSYPTVRSRLDKVIEALRDEIGKTQRTRGSLLDAFSPAESKGAADHAAQLIKRI